MGVDRCIRLLRDADSLVAIAEVLHELRDTGSEANIIELSARDGTVVASVDDIPTPLAVPEDRMRYLTWGHTADFVRSEMIARRSVVGIELFDPEVFEAMVREQGWRAAVLEPLYVPLVDDTGHIGELRFGYAETPSAALRSDLALVAALISVRLAKLGIGPPDATTPLDVLTARQRQVARLATLDRTNSEIADELGVSLDTVKKHLKDAFVRLGIGSRRDLAAMFRRTRAAVGVPPGVSRSGRFHVARLDIDARADLVAPPRARRRKTR